jgi:hypothetical protein
MDKKTVLITGASGGMGRATVLMLRDGGARVFALDKRVLEPEENIIPIEADITTEDGVRVALNAVKEYTDDLFAIIHFAGIYMLDSLVEMDSRGFRRIFDVNLYGAYLVNREFLPLLSRGSRIIITTSELAPLDPLPFTGIYAVTKAALDKYGIKADIIIGCAGGGSNLGGLISPFVGEMLRGEADYQIIAVEPKSCPSLTRGAYAYDYCDTGMVCPLQKMYTLGSGFIPSASHAGGLRYHGMSSVVSEIYDQGLMEARSVEQTEVFKAAQTFAKVEGILPAPESSHAIKVAIDEALKCKETGESKNIVFGLTGTGYFDMPSYKKCNDNEMMDYIPTDEEIASALAKLPNINM